MNFYLTSLGSQGSTRFCLDIYLSFGKGVSFVLSHLSLSAQTLPPALITSPPSSPHQTLLQPSKHKSTPTITARASSFEVNGIKKSPEADGGEHCCLAFWITTARLQSNLLVQDPLFNCPSTFLPYTPRNTNSHADKAGGNPLTFLEKPTVE